MTEGQLDQCDYTQLLVRERDQQPLGNALHHRDFASSPQGSHSTSTTTEGTHELISSWRSTPIQTCLIQGGVNAMALSPDGGWILIASGTYLLLYREQLGWRNTLRVSFNLGIISGVLCFPDGRGAIIATKRGIYVVTFASLKPKLVTRMERDETKLTWLLDSQDRGRYWVLMAGLGLRIICFSKANPLDFGEEGTVIHSHEPGLGYQKRLWRVAISIPGSTLVIGCRHDSTDIEGYEYDSARAAHLVQTQYEMRKVGSWSSKARVLCMASRPDGMTFVSGNEHGTIAVWHRNRPDCIASFTSRDVTCLTVMDTELILCGDENGRVIPYYNQCRVNGSYQTHRGPITHIVSSPAQGTSIHAGEDSMIHIIGWNSSAAEPRPVRPLVAQTSLDEASARLRKRLVPADLPLDPYGPDITHDPGVGGNKRRRTHSATTPHNEPDHSLYGDDQWTAYSSFDESHTTRQADTSSCYDTEGGTDGEMERDSEGESQEGSIATDCWTWEYPSDQGSIDSGVLSDHDGGSIEADTEVDTQTGPHVHEKRGSRMLGLSTTGRRYADCEETLCAEQGPHSQNGHASPVSDRIRPRVVSDLPAISSSAGVGATQQQGAPFLASRRPRVYDRADGQPDVLCVLTPETENAILCEYVQRCKEAALRVASRRLPYDLTEQYCIACLLLPGPVPCTCTLRY